MLRLIALSMTLLFLSNKVQSQTISEIPKLLIAEIESIPEGPHPDVSDSICEWFLIKPETISGMELQRMGWGVMSEVNFGPYQFVSFAGEFNRGTSGMCQRNQGNIAVFQNQKLTSIIYTKPEDDYLIGNLEVIEGGALRVFSGEFIEWPVADIQLTNDGYKIKEISALQSFCEGKSIVPNIYGDTIPQARERLFKFGWAPSKSGDGLWTRAQGMKDRGITEIQSCSGTGLARCFFNYDGANASLEIVTFGEVAEVVNKYSVQCKK